MNYEEYLLWFVLMLPLIFSPGPANIAIASSSAATGFRRSLSVVVAFSIVNVFVASVMGLGMGVVYAKYRTAFFVLEKLGALYVMYLGYKILKRPVRCSASEGEDGSIDFKQGMVMQSLNTKIYPMVIMMYSQFLDGDRGTVGEVLELSALLVGFSAASYLLWAGFGSALGRVKGRGSVWIQRYGFGGLLLFVGACLFLSGLMDSAS